MKMTSGSCRIALRIPLAKRFGVHANLTLPELALVFFKEVFDGVFNGDDAQGHRFIEPLQQGASGRAFALAGGARYEQQPARFLDQSRHRRRQLQVVQFGNLLRHDPERESLCALLLVEIGAIADLLAKEAQVQLVLLLDALINGVGEGLAQEAHDLLVGWRRELSRGNPQELAIDAISEAVVGLRVEVGGWLFGAPVQQFAERSR
jgi:hypothetical protein